MINDHRRRSAKVLAFDRNRRGEKTRQHSLQDRSSSVSRGRIIRRVGLLLCTALAAGTAWWLVTSDPLLPQRAPMTDPIVQIRGIVTHIRDGDTIEVEGRAIRLNGLHAPELDEPLGVEARDAMEGMVQGRQVSCEVTGEGSYDRLVGRCFLGDLDIAARLIATGFAIDCPRYSGGRYAEFERPSTLELPEYCL